MTRFYVATLSSVFCLYTYLFAGAAPVAASSDESQDEVYSYGVRRRQDADVGSAVTVITSGDIEARQYAFVADALKEAPGVAVARNGAFGGFASVRMRGGASGQTLVVIDGVVVNDPSAPQGGYNFANLDVADIDRIEVLRGPQSLIWGADAIGGVVSIRTKGGGRGANASLEGGSRGTVRGAASLSGAAGDAFIRAAVSGVRTDGVSRAASGAERDGYRSIAASISGGVRLTPGADLRLDGRFSDSHSEIDGFPPPTFTLADTIETEDTTDYALAARLNHRSGEDFEGALLISYNNVDRKNFDLGAPTFAAAGDRLAAGYSAAIDLASSLSLEAGAEIERASASVSGIDESATAGAAFLMIEAAPFDNVVVSAGARRDEFSNFDGATTSRVAGVLTLAAGTRLRASWGQGFRAPTLFELNFDQFGVIPNPNLRPERAVGFDFGVEHEFSGLGSGGGSVRAAYFRQRVKDQIDFDFAGAGYFNIGRVKSEGVEFEAAVALARFLDLRLTYSFIDARDALTGARVLRTPKHSGLVGVDIRPSDATLFSASLLFNGAEADFPSANDSFAKLDIRATYAVSDRLDLYGRVENATDARYEDVSGYGEPGASAFAGVRVRL